MGFFLYFSIKPISYFSLQGLLSVSTEPTHQKLRFPIDKVQVEDYLYFLVINFTEDNVLSVEKDNVYHVIRVTYWLSQVHFVTVSTSVCVDLLVVNNR